MARTLAGARLADAEQPAHPAISGAIGRVDTQRSAVGEVEASADDRPARRSCVPPAQARTIPATEPTVDDGRAQGRPSSAAAANSSSGLDAPRRKLKCVVTCSST